MCGALLAMHPWLAPQATVAAEPFSRGPRLSGLSLATYSFRQHMNWWKGKPATGKLSMFDFLEQCAKLDLDAAELTAYFFPATVTSSYLHRLKRRAFRLGLDVSGGAIGNDFGHPPNSDHGRQQIKYTKDWIDRYAELGAPAIRVFAARTRPESNTDAEVIGNVVRCLHEVLPHAEKRGVMLGIENHDFATNLDYLLDIIVQVKSEWLGRDVGFSEPRPDQGSLRRPRADCSTCYYRPAESHHASER